MHICIYINKWGFFTFGQRDQGFREEKYSGNKQVKSVENQLLVKKNGFCKILINLTKDQNILVLFTSVL